MANMTDIIKCALFTPTSRGWGIPILFEAEPGCAKTSKIRQQAKRFGLECEVLSPGERGEAAFGVVPIPLTCEDGKTYLVSAPPGWVRQFNGKQDEKQLTGFEYFMSGPSGVVCIDEVTSTAPALQPALLGLALDMRIGEHYFAPRVRPIALCNPVDQASFGTPLSHANANRFLHIDYDLPTVSEHNGFIASIDVFGSTLFQQPEFDAAQLERTVIKEWRKASNWSAVCGIVAGYLSANEGQKNDCPKVGNDQASKAWASDRTWEYARRAMTSARIHGLDQESTEVMVEGCVGKMIAEELFTYAEKLNLPNSADLLDGKVQFDHESKRIDRTSAVLQSCLTLIINPSAEKRRSRGEAFWGLMDKLIKGGCDKDLFVPPCIGLLNSKPPLVTSSALNVLDALEDMLAAAGINVGSFKS